MKATACLPAILWLLAGCGPSVQAIYEGNVRFEHCYRLDLDPTIAPTHREACWREWKELYEYGQSRDRIDYADRRVRALSSGDYSRPALILAADGGAPDAGGVDTTAASPMPTTANAPPPPTLPATKPPEAGPPKDAEADEVPPPPDSDCASACRQTWLECGAPCRHDAGAEAAAAKAKSAKSCKACDADYKKCMRRCFR